MAEKLVKGLTAKVVITGIILITILSLYFCVLTTPTPSVTQLGSWLTFSKEYSNALFALGFFTFTALVIHSLNRVKRIFSAQETTILLIMVLTSTLMFGTGGGGGYDQYISISRLLFGPGAGTTTRTLDLKRLFANIPSVLAAGADSDYWKNAKLQAWAPINWSYVLPGALWFSLFFISLSCVFVFLALLLRRLYVDEEALPFPISSTCVEMAFLTHSAEPSTEKKPIYRNRYFLVGFLLQFAWLAVATYPHSLRPLLDPSLRPASAREISMQLGSIGGVFVFPEYDYTMNNLFGTLGVPFHVFLYPWAIGWGCMLSIDALTGFIVAWLIFWLIIPVVLTPMGGWIAFDRAGMTVSSAITASMASTYSTLYQYIALGFFIGLALIPLVMKRALMVPILRGVFKEPPSQMDPDRPLPYRYVWIGLIASLILVLVTAVIASIPALPWILLVLLAMVIFIGGFRLIAETGGLWGNFLGRYESYLVGTRSMFITSAIVLLALLPNWYKSLSVENFMADFFLTRVMALIALMMMAMGVCSLESQKMARITKTRLKDALIAVLIAVVVTAVVQCFAYYLLIHIFPAESWWQRVSADTKGGAGQAAGDALDSMASLARGAIRDSRIRNEITILTNSPVDALWRTVLGIVIPLAIFLIRERYAWFRIGAAGVLFGLLYGSRLWSAFAVALVLKYLTIRLGGAQLYQEKLHPLALGLFYAVTIYVFFEFFFFWSSLPIGVPAGV